MREAVHSGHSARRTRQPGFDVAVAVADKRLLGVQAGLQGGCKGCGTGLGVRPEIPFNGQRVDGGLGAPPGVSHHGHRRVANPNHLLHASPLECHSVVGGFDLATPHGAVANGRVQHAWQLEVHAVNLRSVGFVNGVQTSQTLAHQAPVLRVLQGHIGRWLELGCGAGDFAKCRASARRGVGDDTGTHGAGSGLDFPVVGRCLHQHQTSTCAALANVVL